MTCYRLEWWVGDRCGFIRALSTALSFVLKPPSPLCKSPGPDLIKPSGLIALKADCEVQQDSNYKSCQCIVCYVRAFVSGKTGTTRANTHYAWIQLSYCPVVQRLHIKMLSHSHVILSTTPRKLPESTWGRESKTLYHKGDITVGDTGHDKVFENTYKKLKNKAAFLLQNVFVALSSGPWL